MLRTIRAPVAVLLGGGLALTLPPQTRDMLAFLDASSSLWVKASFPVALFVLILQTWFWARAALAARFGIGDAKRRNPSGAEFNWFAFTWLPRLTLIGGALVGLLIAYKSGNGAVAIEVCGVAVAVLLGVIFRPRRSHDGRPPHRPGGLRQWLHGGCRRRLQTLLERAPYGRGVAMTFLAFGLLPLAAGLIEAFTGALHVSNRLAVCFPGPGIAVLLLGLMVGPLTALTFVCDGLKSSWQAGPLRLGLRRPPVLTGLLIYVFVFVPARYDVHPVQTIDGQPLERKSLRAVLDAWVLQCAPNGDIRPVIVSVSGGATRAGLWGAAVLDHVLRAPRDPGTALFAVSSVSGGSLGVAGAMAVLGQQRDACTAVGLPQLRPAADGPVPLAGDALGPLLGGWLIDDIPRAAFVPIAYLIHRLTGWPTRTGDSAEAIEFAFARLWQAASPPGAPGWERPFLSLFYDSTGYRVGMPLWFANGTDATTGNRVITTPILPNVENWPFRGARDFTTLMHHDVSIATAINNTARFPYLEPFGEMQPEPDAKSVGALVDGGYFENEGLQTALDLAEWLARQEVEGRPIHPVIVQATGDGEDAGKASIMTCSNVSDGAGLPNERHNALQIFAPLVGLYHVRGGHSAVLLRQAHDMLCLEPNKPRFVHFYLPAVLDAPVPLNWVLSNQVGRAIWHAVGDDDKVCNETELATLKVALSPLTAILPTTCPGVEGSHGH